MKALAVLLTGVVVLAGAAASRAQDVPTPPPPQREHEWLKQFAGEWETESEMTAGPGQPAVKCKGTESARMLGGYWIVSEMKGDYMGTPVTGLLTVGYDPKARKYVGTWVCSMGDFLCTYQGTAEGKTLSLETEGPHPATGKAVKMKDVVELKTPDHKVLTSYVQGEDGKWVPFMTMNARRKK